MEKGNRNNTVLTDDEDFEMDATIPATSNPASEMEYPQMGLRHHPGTSQLQNYHINPQHQQPNEGVFNNALQNILKPSQVAPDNGIPAAVAPFNRPEDKARNQDATIDPNHLMGVERNSHRAGARI